MTESPDNSVTDATLLLQSIRNGDARASAQLLPLVYGELRKLAHARMRDLPPGQTIQPTALVHEAYIKLVGNDDPGWDGRAHFFGAAAQAMREILVDHARRRSALKRGGDRRRVDFAEDATPLLRSALSYEELLALDAAIDRLNSFHPRTSQVVALRLFAGLNSREVAAALDMSIHAAEREWQFALAWLHKELEGDSEAGSQT